MMSFYCRTPFILLTVLSLCTMASKIISSVLSDDSNHWFIPLYQVEPQSYLNSWAVNIDGSGTLADYIAESHGLVNRGKVGNLRNIYHFTTSEKFDINAKLQHKFTKLLKNDSRILSAIRQIKKTHEQRMFNFPTDPLWSSQWTLYNTGSVTKTTTNLELNVVHAWIQKVTGEEVVLSVVDDGLDYSHYDLSENYDKRASYNFVNYSNDPRPSSDHNHGTSCAGIIAMKKDNGICGVGVAYNAKVGGIRINLDSSSDVIESSALGYRNDYINIYSNSWGPSDSGYHVDGPGELLTATLENGVKMGRKGLGNIYVWASGNGGINEDSCTADGYASSMYTIAIGSADEYGYQANYDESCAAKMAVTFNFNSNSYANNNQNSIQVPTTLNNGRCTKTFTGTSASAPLAAGVIALALNVNSSLTWRDIQYLIVYTSDTTKLKGGKWHINGHGLKVSHQFGFGAIDAEAMVTRARYWLTVPQRTSCFIRPYTTSGTIYEREPIVTYFKVNYGNCFIKYLEHVVVKMTLSIFIDDSSDYPDYYSEDYIYENPFIIFFNGPRRGAITVDLYSPHGTPSYLLPTRKYDFVNSVGYYEWPFTSVQHWGEDPTGLWNISIKFNAQGGHVQVKNLLMTIYGTEVVPEAINHTPSQCNESCARSCSLGNGSEYCDKCQSLRVTDSLLCVSSCPTNYCEIAGYCDKCPVNPGVVAVAIIIPLLTIGLTIFGAVIIGIFVYLKWKNREGYTEF